eukprot:1084624-Prymnesium_polylepis.2
MLDGLSKKDSMVDSDGVSATGVVTVSSNSTKATCALVEPIARLVTISRAYWSIAFRWDPTLPELSITNATSTSLTHGGGAIGGVGGTGGG